jgi:site-specific recombinase XerD
MKNNLFLRQLGEYFNTFLPDIRRASKNTISSYADSFAVFFQFLYETKGLQHTRVTYKHFTPALFDQFSLWMMNNRQYSDSSIRQRTTALSSFLKYASRRDMTAISAYTSAASAERPSVVQSEFPYFTKEETHILLSLPNPAKYLGGRDLVLLSLLYESGARAQEICDLCVEDIRFGKPTKVKLHGKGKKVREVPISDDVTKLLQYHLKQHNLTDNGSRHLPLFSSQVNSKMTTACIRSITKKYVSIAKSAHPALFPEKKYSPHSFRHSKAVHMVEAGVNLIYIRNFLGHATISSTEIYARVGQAAVTKALTERKIPRLTGPAPQVSGDFSLPDFIHASR